MDELDVFKSGINLTEYAASCGYELDRRESSQNSAVMRHECGDKVIIAKSAGGDWIYFSVRDERDNGTIIDFLQNRGGGTLGQVRQSLREWLGGPRNTIPQSSFLREICPVSHDRRSVLMSWEMARFMALVPYLVGRGIGPSLLNLPRFVDCCRVDGRGNVLFPHHDLQGLCGFEIKNRNFTGFASGGVKGLWCSRCSSSDKTLVLTESAIDAFSFHALNPDETTRYMSTGGTLNPQQPALIRGALARIPQGSKVLLAFDLDPAGAKLAQEVRALVPSSVEVGRPHPPIKAGKDWNDALKAQLGLI